MFTIFNNIEDVLDWLKCHKDKEIQQAAVVLEKKIEQIKTEIQDISKLLEMEKKELEEWEDVAFRYGYISADDVEEGLNELWELQQITEGYDSEELKDSILRDS